MVNKILFLGVLVLLFSFGFVGAEVLVLQPNATEGKDAYIQEDDPTRAGGTNDNLDIGLHWQNSAKRALLEFDICSIPANATVNNAELKLYMYNDGPSDDVVIDVHRLTEDWVEGGSGYTFDGATWNTTDGTTCWPVSGCSPGGGDFDSAVEASTLTNVQNQHYSWDLTNLVNDWYGGVEQHGLLLKGADETGDVNRRKRFRSSDYGTENQRPQLIINYSGGNGSWCPEPPEPPEPLPIPTWHIQYNPTPNPGADVEYWNLDLFDIDSATMQDLKSEGTFVMCYFSAGTFEDWRPDAVNFTPEVIGPPLPGWDEDIIDIRSSVVRGIMKARMDLGIAKGCDGFDPDNMDIYTYEDNGFNLTEADAIDYYLFLANHSHSHGKKIGLKNSLDMIDEVLYEMDWAVNEECFKYNECDLLQQVLDDGKPVFQVEYGGTSKANQVCETATEMGMATLIKKKSLNAFEISCLDHVGYTRPADAYDGFESGDFLGGSGWFGNWQHSGAAAIVSNKNPYNGTEHLRLKRKTGYVKRRIDLSWTDNATLGFWAKQSSFGNNDFVELFVSSNGADWTRLKSFTDSDSRQYSYYEFDLDSYEFTNNFWIAFDSELSNGLGKVNIGDVPRARGSLSGWQTPDLTQFNLSLQRPRYPTPAFYVDDVRVFS